jgi:hypothetical protein
MKEVAKVRSMLKGSLEQKAVIRFTDAAIQSLGEN